MEMMAISKPTLTDKLAAYFVARPGRWIDAHVLLPIAGTFGLRSRISDCRKRGMSIENRLTHVKREDGTTWTKTEYRFVPPPLPSTPVPLPFGDEPQEAA